MNKEIEDSIMIIDEIIDELLFLAANNTKVSHALQQLEVVKQLLTTNDSIPLRAMVLFIYAAIFSSQTKRQKIIEALQTYCPQTNPKEWEILKAEISKIQDVL
jgi:hypothetical protein